MATSQFCTVETAPPIEVFALSKAYMEDPFPQKVNLGVGGRLETILLYYCHT